MSIEKCKDFLKDGYGTWDDTSKPTTFANLHDFMDNQNNVTMNLASMLWQPSTEYVVGQVVHSPSLPAGCKATCTTAGTTDASEPEWTDYGTSVTDGTVMWQIESTPKDLSAAIEALHETIKTEMQTIYKQALLDAHPVGSYYWSNESTSPADLFGGTWEALPAGYTLIAQGSGTDDFGSYSYTAGKKYGERMHKLTTEEMPLHSHQYKLYLEANTGSVEDCKMGKFMAAAFGAIDRNIDCPNDGYENHLYASGGGQSHNNTPLSMAAYGWRRTA